MERCLHAHTSTSPPLPLIVGYFREGGIAAEDEEGILIVLEQRRDAFRVAASPFLSQKLTMSIERGLRIPDQILEYCTTGLGAPGNASSTTSTSPHAGLYLLNSTISTTVHPASARLCRTVGTL